MSEVPAPRVLLGTEPVTRLCEYRLELPASDPPPGGHPFVVCLHGMGQSGGEFGDEAGALRHPSLARVFPDGVFAYEHRDAERKIRRRAFAWYVYTGPGPGFALALAETEAYLTRLVRRLVREHPLDPRRSALLGYSQGAYLAGFVAFRNPDLFPGGVVLASGRLKDEALEAEIAAARHLPVLLTHGEKDRFVPIEFAERGLAALERAGHRAARLVRTPGGHRFSTDMQAAALDQLRGALGLDARADRDSRRTPEEGKPPVVSEEGSKGTPAYVFVYGTLMRGMAAEAKLLGAGPVRFVGRAKLPGTLYDFGPFPGAVREKPQPMGGVPVEDVNGEVFELLDPAVPTLAALDAHEGFDMHRPGGSLFLRRRLTVKLEGGGQVEAWTYLYARPIKDARVIPSGDWRQRGPRSG